MADEFVVTSQPIIHFRDPHTGETVRGREVNFRDNQTGQHGRVDVSDADYDPGTVRERIMTELHRIRAVQGLTG